MHYTLHQLEIFRKVAELESITRAAEALYLTQPAISIQIKKFQSQFSQPLFEVIGRQLFITDFGKEIASAAINILNEVEALNSRTHTFNGKLAGKLKIALVSTAKYVMPYFLTDFIHKHKGVTLTMDVTNKTSVVQSLEKNAVDFALVSVVPEGLKINSINLMQNKLFFVGGSQHKMKTQVISPKSINKLPILYREKGSATRQSMEDYLTSQGIKSDQRLELTSNEAIKQAIIAGLGYSIMPLIGIKNELETGDIQILPAKGLPIITSWQLIWLKSKKLSATAQAYIEYLQVHNREIINNKFDWFEKY